MQRWESCVALPPLLRTPGPRATWQRLCPSHAPPEPVPPLEENPPLAWLGSPSAEGTEKGDRQK